MRVRLSQGKMTSIIRRIAANTGYLGSGGEVKNVLLNPEIADCIGVVGQKRGCECWDGGLHWKQLDARRCCRSGSSVAGDSTSRRADEGEVLCATKGAWDDGTASHFGPAVSGVAT
jgi:hypothetical protein